MQTRPLVVTLGVLALCCSAELAHCEPSPSESPVAAEQVLKIDEARRVAMLHNDVAALERLFADDLTIFWGDGSTDTKSSALAALRSHALSYERLDYEGTRVRLYGSTAVVTGRAIIRYRSEEHVTDTQANLTRVYVQQQGEWRLVASQTTRIPQGVNHQ